VHDHPFGNLGVACDLELRHLLDFHQAHPAVPGDSERRMVSVVRDLDPG
jgi:hypothetical protein